MIKKRTGGQAQSSRPFNSQRRNYRSVYDNQSYGAFTNSNASSYRGNNMNFRGGFRGGNSQGGQRGGFRKFTPGFRGGRGFNRGGFRGGNQSQRSGDQFSESGSQFSGFRGGFSNNNNQCKNFIIFFICFFKYLKVFLFKVLKFFFLICLFYFIF